MSTAPKSGSGFFRRVVVEFFSEFAVLLGRVAQAWQDRPGMMLAVFAFSSAANLLWILYAVGIL